MQQVAGGGAYILCLAIYLEVGMLMGEMKSVCVIGAGPAGLHLATQVQKQGFSSVVLEEHADIGRPVQCAGLVSKSGIDDLGIDLGTTVLNEVRGAKMFSPGGEKLVVERYNSVAYVIDRERFDKKLHRTAVDEGVEVMTKAQALSVRGERVFTTHEGRGEVLKARIVVGADGAASKVRAAMGINTNMSDFVHTYQARIQGSYDPEFVELHFGSFAPGFFGWLIPENESVARVGVGAAGRNPKDSFEEFVVRYNFQGKRSDEQSALIPIGQPLQKVTKENLMLVGDAAFQTKATSGGGLVMGITAANACAEAIAEHYKNKTPLAAYSNKLGAVNRELEAHWKVRSYLNSLTKEHFDKLFVKLRKAGIEDFLNKEGDMDRPSRFMGKLAFHPKMWGLLPEVVSVLMR